MSKPSSVRDASSAKVYELNSEMLSESSTIVRGAIVGRPVHATVVLDTEPELPIYIQIYRGDVKSGDAFVLGPELYMDIFLDGDYREADSGCVNVIELDKVNKILEMVAYCTVPIAGDHRSFRFHARATNIYVDGSKGANENENEIIKKLEAGRARSKSSRRV
ncbi:hypothetical protein RG836_01750 [Pseudomonas sp. SZMC_28357]|uniref:hypothetical protein n=1 Tax=Pseudomonas sp. SZMC_28357 TaxID=3074380 RepID=UPI0028727BDE|nr:hypothetical protein [Pseudomonas sp. SZMC_28357]MDR9750160.1 hypothetical protein [Pseudomonas sp. SZMC_28357]